MTITLLLGGVRSGKSARGVRLAGELASLHGSRVLFVATAELHDDDMRERALRHRADRPDTWETLEEPLDVAGAITARAGHHDVILVDCLTLWVSNVLLSSDPPSGEAEFATRAAQLLHTLRSSGAHCVLVSNEVGLGVVPPTQLGRAYRDVLGRVNQVVAAEADTVLLMVAGIEVPLVRRA